MSEKVSSTPDRRDFLKAGAASLFVSLNLGAPVRSALAKTSQAPLVGPYLSIDSNNIITIYTGAIEMGQGIMAAVAQLMAEELLLDPNDDVLFTKKIKVLHGDATRASFTASDPEGSQYDSQKNPLAPFNKPPNNTPAVPNAPAATGYKSQSVGGSTSVRAWSKEIRLAAVAARKALEDGYWQIKGQSATANLGTVGGMTYGAIVSEMQNQGKTFNVPDRSAWVDSWLKSPPYAFIGKAIPRTDIPEKLTGAAKYGIDSAPDGNLAAIIFATVKHSPVIGGTVNTLPKAPSGTVLVSLLSEGSQSSTTAATPPAGNAVGVISNAISTNNTWSIMKIAKGLSVSWINPASTATADSASVFTAGSRNLDLSVTPAGTQLIGASGDPKFALSQSTVTAEFTFQNPFLAHACMEVLNCTVKLTKDSTTGLYSKCEIWAPTQSPTNCVTTARAVLGARASTNPEMAVTVHTTYLGGGLGRKIEQDFVSQALQIAYKVVEASGGTKTVKVTWRREEDFLADRFRPCSQMHVQAGFVPNGDLGELALIYRATGPSIAQQKANIAAGAPLDWVPDPTNTKGYPTTAKKDPGAVSGAAELLSYGAGPIYGPPYASSNYKIEFVPVPTAIPVGYWRSVGESYNTFVVESTIDELALNGSMSPFAIRRMLLREPRALGVLAALQDIVTAPAAGSAQGVAYMSGFGSFIAMVVEISLNAATNQIQVTKVFTAVDCGVAINPDNIQAQIEGGIIHGIAATLWGEVTFTAGKPSASNFSNYRLMKLNETPQFITTINVKSTEDPGGIGELGVPCVAPAIANAYRRLAPSVPRRTTLPFYTGQTVGGI